MNDENMSRLMPTRYCCRGAETEQISMHCPKQSRMEAMQQMSVHYLKESRIAAREQMSMYCSKESRLVAWQETSLHLRKASWMAPPNIKLLRTPSNQRLGSNLL